MIDDQIFAVIRTNGILYVSIIGLCRALSLDSGAQKRRIKRHVDLMEGICSLPIQTPGGEQITTCLNIEKLEAWLAGLGENALEEEARTGDELCSGNLANKAQVGLHKLVDWRKRCLQPVRLNRQILTPSFRQIRNGKMPRLV
ncbi:MAG: phage antirepressor N-terminal domain-containing protein, partial [Ktedonobacteraceae bacterium]